MNRVLPLVTLMLTLVAHGAAGQAQSPPAAPPPQPAATRSEPVRPAAPVRLQVVLSRFNGDKRVAYQPYGLTTVANGRPKILRIGAEVPIGGASAGTKENPGYKSVGTNIVAEVTANEDGRFLVSVSAESSSPYPDDQKQAGRPAFRNHRLEGMAYLKDGQTAEIATATDSLTGEVIKMEVTLDSVK
jgi:hypothetical protein